MGARLDGQQTGGRAASWKPRFAAGLLFAATLLSIMPAVGKAAEVPIPPPGASSRIDAIKERGALRVAVLDEYPWLKQNTNGRNPPFVGPAWLLADEYARRLRVRIETTPVSFDDKVSILKSGQVDITIVPLLQTPERDEIVDFIPYSMAAQCLFGLADNPKVAQAGSIDDLNRSDVTIAFVTDTPQGRWLQTRLPAAARRGISGNITDVAVDEIVSHRADVAPIDQFFFAGLARRLPGLVSLPKGDACLTSRELPIPIGMAIDKGDSAFLAWLRAVARAAKPEVEAEQARVVQTGR